METKNKAKRVLIEINFCGRYQKISEAHQYSNNNNALEINNVLELLLGLGYEVKYNKAGTFYKLIQKQGIFKFQFNMSLKYGNVELIWGIWQDGFVLDDASGPWGFIYKSVLGTNEKPFMPKFRNYEDLREILKEAFGIYEDFKRELLKQENKS